MVGGPLAIVPDDDIERAADRIRPSLALYIGGMGARTRNFHHEVFVRMGYEAQAIAIQDAYLAGDKKGAIAAVTTRMVEDVALIGPWAKITEELARWRQTVLTTLLVNCDPAFCPRCWTWSGSDLPGVLPAGQVNPKSRGTGSAGHFVRRRHWPCGSFSGRPGPACLVTAVIPPARRTPSSHGPPSSPAAARRRPR